MTTAPLGFTIEKAAERLLELAKSPIAQIDADPNNTDHLGALKDLGMRVAEVMDAVFFGLLVEGGMANKDHATTVASDGWRGDCVIECRYEFEKAIEEILADQPHVDPNEEHRLGARQLGVGSYA